MLSLTQCVTEPHPHSRGHTLDVLISKGVVILNMEIVNVALSDHFCVFFDLFVTPKPAVGSSLINDRTGTQFMQMISFENTLWIPLLLSRLEWLKVGKGRHGEEKSRSGHRKGNAGEPNGNGASQNSRFIMRFTKKSYVCSIRLWVEQGRVIFLKSSKTAVTTLMSCLLQ